MDAICNDPELAKMTIDSLGGKLSDAKKKIQELVLELTSQVRDGTSATKGRLELTEEQAKDLEKAKQQEINKPETELQLANNRSSEKLKELETRLRSKESELVTMGMRLSTTMDRVETAEKHVNMLQANLDWLLHQLRSVTEDNGIPSSVTTLGAPTEAFNDALPIVEKLLGKIRELKTGLAVAQEKATAHDALEETCRTPRAHVTRLEKTNKDLAEELEERKKTCLALETNVNTLKTENADLVASRETYKQEVEGGRQKCNALKADIIKLEEQNKLLRKQGEHKQTTETPQGQTEYTVPPCTSCVERRIDCVNKARGIVCAACHSGKRKCTRIAPQEEAGMQTPQEACQALKAQVAQLKEENKTLTQKLDDNEKRLWHRDPPTLRVHSFPTIGTNPRHAGSARPELFQPTATDSFYHTLGGSKRRGRRRAGPSLSRCPPSSPYEGFGGSERMNHPLMTPWSSHRVPPTSYPVTRGETSNLVLKRQAQDEGEAAYQSKRTKS